MFDTVVAVSRAQFSWLVTRNLVTADRCSVIRSAVDLSGFAALPAPKSPCRIFGAIGRLEPQKGFDTLIMAFTQVQDPDARLRIFGEGAQRKELERLAMTDPRITLEGHAPEEQDDRTARGALLGVGLDRLARVDPVVHD